MSGSGSAEGRRRALSYSLAGYALGVSYSTAMRLTTCCRSFFVRAVVTYVIWSRPTRWTFSFSRFITTVFPFTSSIG